jgi:hypothetical protein
MLYATIGLIGLLGLATVSWWYYKKYQSRSTAKLIAGLELCSEWALQWENIGKRRDLVKEKLGIEFLADQDLGKGSPYPCLEVYFYVPKKLIRLATHDKRIAYQLGFAIGAVIPHDEALFGTFQDYPNGNDSVVLDRIREIRDQLHFSDDEYGMNLSPQVRFISGIKASNQFFAKIWDEWDENVE